MSSQTKSQGFKTNTPSQSGSQVSGLSRRDFMLRSTMGVSAMTLGANGLWAPRSFAAEANARSAVVVIFLSGGVDGARLFGAQTFAAAGTFGVSTTGTRVLNPTETDPTNRVVVDASLDTLNPFAKAHFGVAGIMTGSTAHGTAKAANFTAGGKSGLLSLGSAMGGNAPIKVAAVGPEQPFGPTAAVSGVSIQQINDMQATIDALGGGAPDPTMPKRDLAAKAIGAAESMSKDTLKGNPGSLVTLGSGYKVSQDALNKPAQMFNPEELKLAYGLTSTTVSSTLMSKMAAAELMIYAGANVVSIVDAGGWDTHGDTTGARVRGAFTTRVMPALKLFTDRMVTETAPLNVHVMIFGDFNRTATASNHASTTTAAIIGPKIKTGSTGNLLNNAMDLPQGTANPDGVWALLGQLSGGSAVATAVAPGGNPHTRLVAG